VIAMIGVVVPAANEQDRIAACLGSLRAARAHLHRTAKRPIGVRIIVVLDSCEDDTAAIVAAHSDVEALDIRAGRVGVTRSKGAAHLLRSAGLPPRDTWLANTDADSIVPHDWLSVAVAEADRGADLLLGTVLPGPGLSADIERAWRRRHVLRDDHAHVHGANLGIRGDAYLAVGGWAPVATGEDVRLAQRAASTGHLRVVRRAAAPVQTSTRRDGRAPRGFSSYLRGLDAAERPSAGAAP